METDTEIPDRQQSLIDAANMQNEGRLAEAIDLLEFVLDSFPQDQEVKHRLALTYGDKAEKILNQLDRTGLPPTSEQLGELDRLLDRAIELDPELPDVVWDKAVIAARFLHRFEEAEQYLKRAQELDYFHPMVPALIDLIKQGKAGAEPPQQKSNPLLELLRELVEQAQGPSAGILDEEKGFPGIRTLNEYCKDATTLIKDGRVSKDDFMSTFSAANSVDSDEGEYALDFMRRISAEIDDSEIERVVTEAHLNILIEMAKAYRSRVDTEGDRALRRTRRVSKRALGIVKSCGFEVDPDIHAELLLALGGTYAHPSAPQLWMAFDLYLQALELKRKADNKEDISRLYDLLRRMCQFQMDQTMVSGFIGGIGEQVETLQFAYKAAKEIEDQELMIECGLSLAEALGNVNQPNDAVLILKEIEPLANSSQKFEILFTLAARLSETRKPSNIKKAREVGEQQALETKESDPIAKTVWMNLGNYRRLDGDINAAREAFQRSLELCPEPEENEVPVKRGQITTLLAEAEILLGNNDTGKKLLEQAITDYIQVTGTNKLQFESIAARLYFKLGEYKSAIEHADRGIHERKFILEKGASPNVWESMLQEWTRLDVNAVRARHQIGGDDNMKEALLIAEATKGRLFAWLSRVRWGHEAHEFALDPHRQENSLTTVQEWAKQPGRWVISLFAHKEGMSVMAVKPGGVIYGKWIDTFDYDDLRLRVFDPLEQGIDSALDEGNAFARGMSSAIMDMLLAKVGVWLWHALPDLEQGGNELVLLPHRLLRSLPLSHVELPSGTRLSELFERVTILPNLYELGVKIKASQDTTTTMNKDSFIGLVDSDVNRKLPFARLECLTALGNEQTISGNNVTVEALKNALSEPGNLVLSCHGHFNEDNPWDSTIHSSDGDLSLSEFVHDDTQIDPELIVLGVCEAGKSRRSISDEPLSFPSFLLNLGAHMVVAPMWQVDDFVSFLFVRRFVELVKEGKHPAQALTLATNILRTLTARDALKELESVLRRIENNEWPLDDDTLSILKQRTEQYTRWLNEDVVASDYAFDTLDWSAFQLFGY